MWVLKNGEYVEQPMSPETIKGLKFGTEMMLKFAKLHQKAVKKRKLKEERIAKLKQLES